MNGIIAKGTEKAIARDDGLGNLECPICHKVIFELDIEKYHEFESDRTVELCTTCREDFERDEHEILNSDTLDPLTFAKLWAWGVASRQSCSHRVV